MTAPVASSSVRVTASPEDAFAVFTDEIGLWWRRDTPYWNDPERAVSVRLEPWVGGRFVEVHDVETGEGFEVGRVTTWEPGRRVAFTWTQVGWPADVTTQVEVVFSPTPDGTLIELTHGGFDSVPDAHLYADGYDAGWKALLGWLAEHTNARKDLR